MMLASNEGRTPQTKKGDPMEPLSAKEAAKAIGTDARTLRKYLRSKNGLVGQGNRWALEGSKKAIGLLKKDFDAWNKSKGQGKKVTPILTSDDEDLDDEVEELETIDAGEGPEDEGEEDDEEVEDDEDEEVDEAADELLSIDV